MKSILTYQKQLLVVLFICFSFTSLYSAHLVGGEMSYRCLGGNSYEITLRVYRDCQSSTTVFDQQARVGIFNHVTGTLVSTLFIQFSGESNIPINAISSCLVVPPGLCLKQTTYTDTVTLLPNTAGYDLVYQRCCRGPSIINITSPAAAGNTYYSFIPANDTSCNSSPSFSNSPPVFMCINDSIDFDYSATDPDGDSLVYEFVTPYIGGTSFNPSPVPSPPPFSTVNWATGYSVTNQINGVPPLTLNSATGQLTGVPNSLGKHVVGVKVKEYRNGVLLSETIRDFQFNVLNCQKSVAAIFDPGTICNSFTVTFANNSLNATTYLWNFGDTSTLLDTSVLFSPQYTYPDTGVYTVMLIADPNSPVCRDTGFLIARVFPLIYPRFTAPVDQCFVGNTFDFTAAGNYYPTTRVEWDFGPNASQRYDTTLNPTGVQFSAAGPQTVSLRYRDFGCDTTISHVVTVLVSPSADFNIVPNQCVDFTIQFNNASANAISYHWDFGVTGSLGDTSTLVNPLFTFPDSGRYTVRLIVDYKLSCPDTIFKTFWVKPILYPTFIVPGNQCFKNNSYDFTASGQFYASTQILWSFGAGSNPATSASANETGVNYTTDGMKTVTLRYQDFGCDTSITGSFTVYDEINAGFTITQDTVCEGDSIPTRFTSTSGNTLNHLWIFGDGDSSKILSPFHLYNTPGSYDLTLIVSDVNCADTLFKPSQLVVLLRPIADFYPLKTSVPAYAAAVTFTNNSLYEYNVSFNGGEGATVVPFTTTTTNYSESGYYYPMLIAFNSLGCRDTMIGEVFVVPEIYVPNSFTPNQDGLNEVFLPSVSSYADYDLKIFNRWGELIFQTTDPKQGWNGKAKDGTLLEQEVYVYRILYRDPSGLAKELFGNVNLLR